MKKLSEYVLGRLIAGALMVAPIYLAVLLLLKGMKSLTGVLKPVAHLLPTWLPADEALSLLVVLVVCFLVGLAVRTRIGPDTPTTKKGETIYSNRLQITHVDR